MGRGIKMLHKEKKVWGFEYEPFRVREIIKFDYELIDLTRWQRFENFVDDNFGVCVCAVPILLIAIWALYHVT